MMKYLFITLLLLQNNIVRIVYDILMIDDDEDKEKGEEK